VFSINCGELGDEEIENESSSFPSSGGAVASKLAFINEGEEGRYDDVSK